MSQDAAAAGARNFLYSGAENCESAAPGLRFPQIPPQGPPPGRRALRRTAATGKKSLAGSPRAVLPAAQQQTRNTVRFPQNILFLGSCPTSGAWRWFSNRCRTRRCRRSSRSGSGATRFGSVRPSPALCFSTSGRWFGNSTATRRALCGFSPLDYQDKPKVDDDGKPVVSEAPQTGSHNFSRLSLLESKEPWVDVMVRQLREQGRIAGFRRAPRLRRQGRGQSRGRPAARPARLPTPTGGKHETTGVDWGKHETTGVDGKTGKGEVVVRLQVVRRREVRDSGGFQRHPSVESRDQRAEQG